MFNKTLESPGHVLQHVIQPISHTVIILENDGVTHELRATVSAAFNWSSPRVRYTAPAVFFGAQYSVRCILSIYRAVGVINCRVRRGAGVAARDVKKTCHVEARGVWASVRENEFRLRRRPKTHVDRVLKCV